MRIILCDEDLGNVSVFVTAELENNKLSIFGQDLQKKGLNCFGKDEHEYSYAFDEENTRKLLNSLKSDEKMDNLLNQVSLNFSGLQGCMVLKKFCAKNEIEYSFFSW